ncbi:YafY family transcriptional regulator [Plantibacter sp. CFBP 8798]|uniref:helix-turn-helix transcriptional regulator n=1 Tax=Plantibacter sp. CFBP 8798 TaxID=2775268 RepID=UPI001784639E|nr:YafY family protein [Plantibacter sp. CFBP 8798]MBD8465295.1 YafY family transcriptional regulator [Plantibacter sp. CFBP 8798]
MWDTTSRTFQLLGMLQRNGFMASDRLASDLGVTTRTLRRDVARLRDLGYPVDTRLGVDGGYSIEPGAVLPPISLSTEEALACALALRRWTEDADRTLARSSLDKIQASMPPRVRWIVGAMAEVTVDVAADGLEPIDHAAVDIGLLGELARSCVLRRRAEFHHTSRDGTTTRRRVDPHRLVHTERRWYLVAFDLDADDWRTFRTDRVSGLVVSELPARTHTFPGMEVEEWVTRGLQVGWRQVGCTVRVHAPAASVRRWVAPAWGSVEAETPKVTLVHAGADSYDAIARWLLLMQAEVEVIEPDGLRSAFDRVAAQARRAARTDDPGGPTGAA